MRYEVAVIGAGVVGLFTAYSLAKRGCRVIVVEKEDGPGKGVTSRQANVVHVVQTPFRSLRGRLCIEGNRLYRTRVREELGIRIRETVTLIAATTRMGVLKLVAAKPYLSLNLPREYRPRLLRWKEAVELEPHLSDNVLAALVIPGYAVVDYRDIVSRLRKALDELGVEQLYKSSVVGAHYSLDTVVLETSSGVRVEASFVVNAAGLYSDIVASMLGDKGFKITPRKGVILVYRRKLTETIVTSIEAPRGRETKGGAIIPQLDGRTFVGPNLAGETSREDYTYSRSDVELLRNRFRKLVSIELGEPDDIIVGLRPATRKGDFIVAWGSSNKSIHLVGIESPGLTAAPALAELVASKVAARVCRALQR